MAVSGLNCFRVSKILYNSLGKRIKPCWDLGKRYGSTLIGYSYPPPVTVKLQRESLFKLSTVSAYISRRAHIHSHASSQGFNKAKESAGIGNADTNNQQGTDDEKAKESWNKFTTYMMYGSGLSITVIGSYIMYLLGQEKVDENGKVIEDEFSSLPFPQRFFFRLLNEIKYYQKMASEPSRDKLLPEPLTYPYIQPPYTLVLELTDLLVHPEWTYQTGWRFKKRPGVDHFLEQIAPPLFEVVVFTAEPGMTVFPILDALDPNGYIMYRLFRDATHFVDGHHVKDLNHLNRDLKKVIVVDWNPESVKFHRNNALVIPRWKGNDDDLTLVDLAAFLKTIAIAKVDDVRETLEYYQQFENPVEAFRENQRKLMEQIEEKQRLEKEKPNLLTTKGSWSPSFLHKKPQ